MRELEAPPQFDKEGLNVLDPSDRRGHKSRYITTLHREALLRLLPRPSTGQVALDVGCGWGRIGPLLRDMGWNVIGIDPDERQLAYARRHTTGVSFVVAGLPSLPIAEHGVHLLLLHNVARPLHLMGKYDDMRVGNYVAPGGHVVVVDNLWKGREDYPTHDQIVRSLEDQGLDLESWQAIRAGRWWGLPLITAGFVPESWHKWVADREIAYRTRFSRPRRWRYLNVLYVFVKPI